MSHICVYRLDFADNDAPEFGLLHRGTKDECERVADLIPAVSYSGGRHVQSCRIGVFEDEQGEAK